MSEVVVNVDSKGRVLIPSRIRKRLNIGNAVKMTVEGGRIILTPMEDPLKRIEKIVIKGTSDVEAEIRRLRRVAEENLLRGLKRQ